MSDRERLIFEFQTGIDQDPSLGAKDTAQPLHPARFPGEGLEQEIVEQLEMEALLMLHFGSVPGLDPIQPANSTPETPSPPQRTSTTDLLPDSAPISDSAPLPQSTQAKTWFSIQSLAGIGLAACLVVGMSLFYLLPNPPADRQVSKTTESKMASTAADTAKISLSKQSVSANVESSETGTARWELTVITENGQETIRQNSYRFLGGRLSASGTGPLLVETDLGFLTSSQGSFTAEWKPIPQTGGALTELVLRVREGTVRMKNGLGELEVKAPQSGVLPQGKQPYLEN
ncbi:MAG: hypothetical protein VX768_11475 [Planctomycetota bacterium]|nr:hypothetical protein [Planctomycetota bacterium]